MIFAVHLLGEIIFETDLLNHVQLRFKEIDVMFFIGKDLDQKLTAAVVRNIHTKSNAPVQPGNCI